MTVRLQAVLLHRLAKPVVFALALLPFAWLVLAIGLNQLGANPAQALERACGDWTLRFLCLVLALTPLRVMSGMAVLARFRRMLGLFVFFYAVLHLLSYSWFDMGFEIADIVKDIPKRPFILVGVAMFVLLSLLAMTSFNRAIKWLGARRWRNLHRLIYVVAVLAILHFFWMRAAKNDFTEVWVYAAVLGSLLLWRGAYFMQKKLRPKRVRPTEESSLKPAG